jgi:hypothetical protein
MTFLIPPLISALVHTPTPTMVEHQKSASDSLKEHDVAVRIN